MKAGWEVQPLGDVCNLIGGGTPSKKAKDYYGGTIPWVTVRDMNVETIEVTDHSITEVGLKNSSSKVIPKGEVIIASRVGLGKVCKLSADMAINQDLKGVIPKRTNEIDRQFLFYWFQSVASFIEENGVGATVQGVKLSFLNSLDFPVVPLEEQKRIVAVLDAAFEGLTRAKENAEANLQNARELFEAGRSSIFEAQLKNSPLVQLGKICSRVSVGHVGETTKHYVEEGGVPFLRSQNVRPTGIELDGAKRITHDFHMSLKKSQLIGGELLFVRVGANRGQCCYVPEGLGELNCANVVFGRPKTGNVNYLAHYCQSRVGQENLLGMTTGSAQGVINTRSVATLPIPMPEESIQFETSKNLDRLQSSSMATEDQYGTKLTDIADLRQSLLQKAFAGELT